MTNTTCHSHKSKQQGKTRRQRWMLCDDDEGGGNNCGELDINGRVSGKQDEKRANT